MSMRGEGDLEGSKGGLYWRRETCSLNFCWLDGTEGTNTIRKNCEQAYSSHRSYCILSFALEQAPGARLRGEFIITICWQDSDFAYLMTTVYIDQLRAAGRMCFASNQ
jgi:hypothetical protein